MSTPDPADQLYADCLRLLATGPSTNQRTRSMPGAVDMSTLIVWNILVAGVMHIGCGLVSHALWERLAKLDATLRTLGLRKGGAPRAEVEAAAKAAEAAMDETIPQLPGSPDATRKRDATASLRQILVEMGWAGAEAEQKAGEIVQLLTVFASHNSKPSGG